MLTTPMPAAFREWSPETLETALSDLLLRQGRLDEKSLDRGRRLARDGGGRLDSVLTQLGLLSERGLAEVLSELLGLEIAAPSDYPVAAVLPDRLRAKFLRKARALPLSIDQRAIRVAMADPLDRFAISAIAIAAVRPVERIAPAHT